MIRMEYFIGGMLVLLGVIVGFAVSNVKDNTKEN